MRHDMSTNRAAMARTAVTSSLFAQELEAARSVCLVG